MTLILLRTLAVLSVVCFMVGLNLVLVTLVTAAIGAVGLTTIQQWRKKNTTTTTANNKNDDDANVSGNIDTTTTSILSTLDYTPLIYLASQLVLVGGMADTGVPQMLLNYGMGQYAEYMTGGIPSLIRFMIWIGILTIITSPVATVIMLAASYPYANPYDWIQIAWIVTMASRFSVFGSIDGRPSSTTPDTTTRDNNNMLRRKNNMLYNIPFTIVMCFLGCVVIRLHHVTKECSVRLGTCPEYDGGWRS